MKSYSKTLQLVLPDSFQEILIANEMRFERGERSVHLIRNLLYLYSIGTEYYDTINNTLLHSYYRNKSDCLIRDPDVIATLEDNPKNVETIELFEENNLYKVVKKGDFNEKKTNDKISSDGSDNQYGLMTSPSLTYSSDSNNNNDIIRPIMNNCISYKLFLNLSNIDSKIDEEVNNSFLIQHKSNIEMFQKKIEDDLIKQLERFKLRKKKRQLKQYLIKKRKGKSYIKRSKEVLKASSNVKIEETNKVLDEIVELTHKLFICEQKQMEKEIESFIDKNIKEMHSSIKELRESITKEAKEMEENGFPKVAKLLYEDIDSEIEMLRQQYEESRLSGIDKIRNKFLSHLKRNLT